MNLKIILYAVILAMLQACGQTGPLYLPDDEPPIYVPEEEKE
jgi:predicted small lipoprotein YifL